MQRIDMDAGAGGERAAIGGKADQSWEFVFGRKPKPRLRWQQPREQADANEVEQSKGYRRAPEQAGELSHGLVHDGPSGRRKEMH